MTFAPDAQPLTTEFIVVGDIMVDTFAQIDGPLTIGVDHFGHVTRRIGGQAANTAAWLASLDKPVRLLTASGDDDDGAWARSLLESAGVVNFQVASERALAQAFAQASTGRCVVVVDSEGSRTMISAPGANRRLADLGADGWTDLWKTVQGTGESPAEERSPRRHLHLSGYLMHHSPDLPGVITHSARSAWPSISTSFDAAAASPTPGIQQAFVELLPELDLVFATSQEILDLHPPGADASAGPVPEDDAESLLDRWRSSTGYTGTVVLKLGARGAVGDSGDGADRVRIDAPSVQVVDTTGAGDAFAAGFLAAWVPGQNRLTEAMVAGAESASRAISRIGAGPPTTEGR